MNVAAVRAWLLGSGALVALFAAACGGAGDGDRRTVLIDFVHDEVASSFLYYFPRDVTVHPGDTVVFKQEWAGEPHSVTMGTMVDDMMRTVGPLIEEYGDRPEEEVPPGVFEQFEAAMADLPWMFPDDFPDEPVNQNVAQPCYLDEGGPPKDPATPCDDEDQRQPPFNGRQSYYNSGYIHYEEPHGNTFEVPLADDIAPGTYNYYCNLHGPFMAGTVTVVSEDQPIPSQEEVSRQARAEIDEQAGPLIASWEAAKAGDTELEGQTYQPPLAGWHTPGVHGFVSEFYPKEIRTRAGETVTWSFVGGHTVSFDVPEYFAQLVVEDDGTVVFSPDAVLPRGGPGYPKQEEPPRDEDAGVPPPAGEDAEESPHPGGEEGGQTQSGGEDAEEPPPPAVQAGEWDGEGFLSSGVFWDGTYSITFTNPGTYPYACLIHPQMVATVIVQ